MSTLSQKEEKIIKEEKGGEGSDMFRGSFSKLKWVHSRVLDHPFL